MMGREAEAIALFKKGRDHFTKLGYPVGTLVATLDLANTFLENKQPEEAGRAYRDIIELLNILSRASALGGAFVTQSKLPHGTIAWVSVPI